MVIVAKTGGDGKTGALRRVDLPDPPADLRELSPAQVGRAVEHSSAAVIITDARGRIEYVNPCFSETTGYRLEDIVGKTPRILQSGHTSEGEYRALWSTIRRGDDWHGEFCNRRKDGTLYWNRAAISPVKAADGAITHFVAIQVDIGERKRVEQELRDSEQRFRSLVETSPLGICIEQNGKPLFVNQSFAEIYGYDAPADIIQLGSLELLHVQGDLTRLIQSRQRHARGRASFEQEIRGVKKDGSIIWLQTQTTMISWNGEPAAQTTVVDITTRKSREDRLHHEANYDLLTDLPSRKLALDRLDSAIVNARRRRHRVAALFIDVDRFKAINDVLGHAGGDWLLRQLGERIRSSIREEDTVARLGGDEFVIVLPEVREHADAEAVAGKILDAIVRPFIFDGQEAFVTVSIGVAVFPDQGDDAEALLRHADTAMYVAKERGRGRVHVFSDELGQRKRTRTRLEAGLRRALERDELTLCYQPLVDIRSGRIVGAEALLRWFDPEHGQISPQQFVRLAEHTGMIVPIGEWVLTTGCREARRWVDAGFADVYLSVNVSSRQFRGNSLIESVRRAMASNRLHPECLELEFTESLLLEDLAEIRSTLRGLESWGVRLAVDDFGTGYSALSYLNRVPLDTLKIDRSFIIELLTEPGQSSLVDALILMAHRLQLRVIAEGVESREQLDALRARGCDVAQGYYLSPPLPPGEFLALLRTWRSSTVRAG
jgi:diguanylate cyclase (GGDEF)-like protein/PAS domain S-box-containing protein